MAPAEQRVGGGGWQRDQTHHNQVQISNGAPLGGKRELKQGRDEMNEGIKKELRWWEINDLMRGKKGRCAAEEGSHTLVMATANLFKVVGIMPRMLARTLMRRLHC